MAGSGARMLDLHITKRRDNFTLDIRAGSAGRVLGIIGPSGAGKTTILDCIAGITTPDAGTITLNGTTLVNRPTPIGAPRRSLPSRRGATRARTVPPNRRGIAYVFQNGMLFPHMTVDANLRYGLHAHGPGPGVADVVDLLELGPLCTRRADKLSGGEARRVAIGRALLSGPRLMLLDEPLTGLDRRLAARTLDYIRRVLTTFAVPAVYVSHAISDVVFLCDDTWCIDAGRLIAHDTPRHVITQPGVLTDADWLDLENVFNAERLQDNLPNRTPAVYRVGTQRLTAAPEAPAAEHHAMLAIHAADIIVARVRPERISARNVLRARIARLAELKRKRLAFVALDGLDTDWMVELTPDAVADLELQPGTDVFLIIKASAVSVLETHATRVPPAASP